MYHNGQEKEYSHKNKIVSRIEIIWPEVSKETIPGQNSDYSQQHQNKSNNTINPGQNNE